MGTRCHKDQVILIHLKKNTDKFSFFYRQFVCVLEWYEQGKVAVVSNPSAVEVEGKIIPENIHYNWRKIVKTSKETYNSVFLPLSPGGFGGKFLLNNKKSNSTNSMFRFFSSSFEEMAFLVLHALVKKNI